jgi:hypothetical protein
MRAVLLVVLLVVVGCAPAEKCATTDYECNLRLYRQELYHRPPDYSRARQLARAEYLNRNVQNVLREKDDYVASSLLRVLAEYPKATRQALCANSRTRSALQRRGELMQSPLEYGAYTGILQQQIGC